MSCRDRFETCPYISENLMPVFYFIIKNNPLRDYLVGAKGVPSASAGTLCRAGLRTGS